MTCVKAKGSTHVSIKKKAYQCQCKRALTCINAKGAFLSSLWPFIPGIICGTTMHI